LNLIFPIIIGSFKRFKGPLYTFVYPKEWVADTFLALAKAQRQAKSLDYRMMRTTETATLPDQGMSFSCLYRRYDFIYI
jgi:hypothetical protein